MNNIKRVNISNFNEQQKTNYIKNLLYNNDINDVLKYDEFKNVNINLVTILDKKNILIDLRIKKLVTILIILLKM